MTEPTTSTDEAPTRIAAGYQVNGPALRLGAVMHDGNVFPAAQVQIAMQSSGIDCRSKYGDLIDRDSAYEQLGRRTQEAAAQEEQEQASNAQKAQPSAQRQSAPAREPAPKRVKAKPSGFEKFIGNSTVKEVHEICC